MAITIEKIVTPELDAASLPNVFLRGEHSYVPPIAGFDGASFPALPTLKHIALVTTVFISALGTTSAVDASSHAPLPDLRFTLPVSLAAPSETAAERFSRLRREIVAAGIPLLEDDALRDEIESRKGEGETNIR